MRTATDSSIALWATVAPHVGGVGRERAAQLVEEALLAAVHRGQGVLGEVDRLVDPRHQLGQLLVQERAQLVAQLTSVDGPSIARLAQEPFGVELCRVQALVRRLLHGGDVHVLNPTHGLGQRSGPTLSSGGGGVRRRTLSHPMRMMVG